MPAEEFAIMVDKFVFRARSDRAYSPAGVWARYDEATGVARLGLSDFSQQTYGDVAFVELPSPGVALNEGEEMIAIETVKADVNVVAPFACEVIAVNEALDPSPELINQQPYDAGWLLDVRPASWPATGLIDAAAYLELVRGQAEAGS